MFSAIKDRIAYVVTGLHQALFDLSNGAILGSAGGAPFVKLTTIGRKSGKPRTTMLTSPVQRGDDIVVIASYGGDDRHPQWYKNLAAQPDVEITYGGRTRKMRARTATAEEKAELWREVGAKHSRYAGYQRRTARDIPVVVLSPR